MEEVANYAGSLGHIFLAICGIPTAIAAIYTKRCTTDWALLCLWGIGELLAFAHALYHGYTFAYANYTSNILSVGVMIYYRARTRISVSPVMLRGGADD